MTTNQLRPAGEVPVGLEGKLTASLLGQRHTQGGGLLALLVLLLQITARQQAEVRQLRRGIVALLEDWPYGAR